MTISKYDSSNIKILNKKIILKIVHKYRPISRNDIATLTGLKGSSVTRLVSELIEEGHIIEGGMLSTGTPGRKKIMLEINPNYKVSMLLDIGVNTTTLAVGFYDGSVKTLHTFHTPKNAEKFFEKVKKYYTDLEKLYKLSTVVLSVPGMVDISTNTIINAPNIGWKNIRIGEFLEVNVPVLADNEANLSVLAEKYHSKLLGNFSDIVFVLVREGVGTGILISNSLIRGKFYSAGEFGHMTIDINSSKKCHCGKNGCWELYSSIRYALSKAKKELGLNASSFEELVKLEKAKPVIVDMAKNIGRGIVNIVNAINPEVVILGGAITNMPYYFYHEISKVVRNEALRPANEKVIILPTMFKDISSNLVGANIYAIDYWIDKI